MRQVALIIILFSCFWNLSYSQSPCNCDVYKKQFSELESLLEKKDFKIFDTQFNSLKTTDFVCQQKKWALLMEEYTQQNNITKADSVSDLFFKSITKKTCEPILALYNYQKGSLELKNNAFENATNYLIKANEQTIALKDTLLRLKAMAKLALSFNKLRQPEKAVEYDKTGIKLLSTYKNEKQLVQYVSNMVGHFGVWYDVALDKRYLDSIKKYIPVSITLARKLDA